MKLHAHLGRTRPRLRRPILNLLFKGGLLSIAHGLWRDRLTVLAYHRIEQIDSPNFNTFKPNVSSSPPAFEEQMEFLRRYFNVISISQLIAWLRGSDKLPPYPAVITFDDGYRDNHVHALPVLKRKGLPAVVFLATNCIGSSKPFYWDLAAYCFLQTRRDRADLPILGPQAWPNAQARSTVMRNWVTSAKNLTDSEKQDAVAALPGALGVSVDEATFANLHMTWDEVREMSASGIEMGAHTQSHAILTRIPLERAREEIFGCKQRIETELGRPVVSFAYPNGLAADFGTEHRTLLQQAGIDVAFSLIAGPARLDEARRDPLAIRRIFISHRDDLASFVAKATGLSRFYGP
jgi:peptidoglycan/xylan/chitin deacetylase (PgdA/CDA1 family)